MKLPARPAPPGELLDPDTPDTFLPDLEARDWFMETFVEEGSRLTNPDHRHLSMATIGVLWTNVKCVRQMIPVVGMAQIPRPNPISNDWDKARYWMQIRGWFGWKPDFLITLYAPYASRADNASYCALVEHELYHCALKCFTNKGKPIFAIRGHDVEEHVGVVRRYGAGAAAGQTKELVRVARLKPEIAPAVISGVCGTCLKLAA